MFNCTHFVAGSGERPHTSVEPLEFHLQDIDQKDLDALKGVSWLPGSPVNSKTSLQSMERLLTPRHPMAFHGWKDTGQVTTDDN